MPYPKATIRAIKESIKHHEENLRKLQTAKGEFENTMVMGRFQIRRVFIYFTGDFCALCDRFGGDKKCLECPLELKGYGCENDNSPWQAINHARTRPQAIKAEKNMIRVLKGLLK